MTHCKTCQTAETCMFYGVCLEGNQEKVPPTRPRDEAPVVPPRSQQKPKPKWKVNQESTT